jgi:transcriptional regulator CtsR
MGLFDFFKKEEVVVETQDVMSRQETVDFVSTHRAEVDYKFDLLRKELMDKLSQVQAIVDPIPASLSQQQILDIIVNVIRTEAVSKEEMLMMREDLLLAMDEKIKMYDVDEDAEMAAMMDQKLEHLEG